ncbi:MAG: hypothetical protein UV05_C0057G0006 [candidate division CPR1 bacterium GW2011_GWA2_42_17]|uniref:Uncharacterized protein n=1 Tax=candidate division CPR1 bacterium GW2011_GWA2_42_17 TaxID=1618341 RepID=A0A0G0YXF8_9BACT|nr:MAG: hypothetical protein UV05_C0057G0006 [candidate division CPR1 bacterium GW2011_GWA2_42_17]
MNEFSEDKLIEQTAVKIFAELWGSVWKLSKICIDYTLATTIQVKCQILGLK